MVIIYKTTIVLIYGTDWGYHFETNGANYKINP